MILINPKKQYLHEMPISVFGKNLSHETTHLITYKYIREYWLTKSTFFLDIICLVLTIQKVTEHFLEKYYTERASKQLLEKLC